MEWEREVLDTFLKMGVVGDVSKAVGTLLTGLEVKLAQKTAKFNSIKGPEAVYQEFQNEATFLEAATRAGIKGVPWLFSQAISRHFSTINMQWIDGASSRGLEGEGLNDRKICALYVATMANVTARTGFVKRADNKLMDSRVVRPELSRVGDLVIIDWGFAEKATPENTLAFLVEMFRHFVPRPPFEADQERLFDPYYGQAFKRVAEGFSLYARNYALDPTVGKSNRREANQLLATSKDTPIRTMLLGMNNDKYVGHLDDFVRVLTEYFGWLDGFDKAITSEQKVAREEAYQNMIANLTGSGLQNDGIDLKAAEPWISNLDLNPNPQVRPASFETIISRPEGTAYAYAAKPVQPQPLEARVEQHAIQPPKVEPRMPISASPQTRYDGPPLGFYPGRGLVYGADYVNLSQAGKMLGLPSITVISLAHTRQIRVILRDGQKLVYRPSIDYFNQRPEQERAESIAFANSLVAKT